MILQGTPGGNFDIFAASGESTAWVLLWKTCSRPIGVRVCPVAQFNFFSTAFDPRAWTMVVFWKEILGRQPQLIPENKGGDNTNYPFPPNETFFVDPEVLFGPQGPQPPAAPEPHQPPGSPGVPPGWPPAPPPAGGRERVGTGTKSRERLHPRPSPPEPQLIPVPMSDGEDDDDQPPQRERQRQRSRSRERVNPHEHVPQEPQIQPVVTSESDDEISDKDFTIINPSSPSAGPPPSSEQRNRSRRSERSRSRVRVYPRSSSQVSRQQQPAVPPPPGIQQNQAIQSEDEHSATVGPLNHVSDHSRSPQDQEDTRRQGTQEPKGKNNTAGKQPSTPPKGKKYKPMHSDEQDEEPQTTVPVLPLQQGPAASSQGPAASSQGPAASANSGDEDSEYSDEYSAQSQHSGRTVIYADLYVQTNNEHWAMTPETHKYAAAAGSFVL